MRSANRMIEAMMQTAAFRALLIAIFISTFGASQQAAAQPSMGLRAPVSNAQIVATFNYGAGFFDTLNSQALVPFKVRRREIAQAPQPSTARNSALPPAVSSAQLVATFNYTAGFFDSLNNQPLKPFKVRRRVIVHLGQAPKPSTLNGQQLAVLSDEELGEVAAGDFQMTMEDFDVFVHDNEAGGFTMDIANNAFSSAQGVFTTLQAVNSAVDLNVVVNIYLGLGSNN